VGEGAAARWAGSGVGELAQVGRRTGGWDDGVVSDAMARVQTTLPMLLALLLVACATSETVADHQQPVNWAKPWMPEFTSSDAQDHAHAITAFNLDVVYAEGNCTITEQVQAVLGAEGLRTAKRLFDFFQSFAQCDNDGIAERISESVTITLDSYWEQVADLAEYAQRDATFGDFIVRHIDETVAHDRVVRIRENAHSRCPQKAKELCELIRGDPPR